MISSLSMAIAALYKPLGLYPTCDLLIAHLCKGLIHECWVAVS